MTTTKHIGRELLLWTGAVLGSLCLASLAAGWLLNVTPLVFASGSMSPAYETGALGIAHEVPAADLRVGDVVSVVNAQGDRVTHRVVGTQPTADGAVLSLKGDTNEVPDAEVYRVAAADRVVAGVPYAGYVLNAVASPVGLLAGALAALAMLYLGFGPRRDVDATAAPTGAGAASRRSRVAVPVALSGVVALGVVLGVSGNAPWAFTSAYWSDTASATATATTPAAVSHQQPVCTSSEVNPKEQATLTWSALGPLYEFRWELYRDGVAAPISTGTIAPAADGTPLSLMFGIVSGGGQNDGYSAKVQTRLVSDHSNVGPATTTLLHSGPRPNGANWWMYCGP